MVEIKGSVVIDSINAIKSRNGEKVLQDVFDQLGSEAREYFTHENILPTAWCSLDYFVELLEQDIKLTAGGDEQELIKRSKKVIEKQLSGIYRVFARFGSPEFLLKRLSTIHQTYFRGVSVAQESLERGKASLKYAGFMPQHRLMEKTIIGFYCKALEISGAKEVKAEFSIRISDNKGYCLLTLTWSGK
jgi:hypothetical protein